MKTCLELLKKYYTELMVAGICAYGLYLRASWRAANELWHDEKWQIIYMHLPFIDFVKSMPKVEHSGYIALDFYLIYPFFQLFGKNEWGLAIPHIVFTVAGLYLLYRICKIYCSTILSYVIVFSIVCLNKTLVIHSFEIRSYAILPTLALGAFLLSRQLVDENVAMSLKKKFLIGLFFVLVIWSFAYGIVMLGMILLFFLFNKRADSRFSLIFRDVTKLMAVVLAIAMPLWIYSIFFAHLAHHHVENVFHYIPNPLVNPVGFLKAIFGNLVGVKALYFLLAGVFFPLLLPYKARYAQLGLLFLLVFIPIGLLMIAAMKAQYWFLQRHFIWVMPFFALYLGWAWESAFLYITDKVKRKNTVKGDRVGL